MQDQVGGLNPPGDCSTWILAKVRTKNMDWRLQDCPNSLSGIEKTCASDLLPNTVDNIFLAKYRTVAAHNRYQYIRSYESLVKIILSVECTFTLSSYRQKDKAVKSKRPAKRTNGPIRGSYTLRVVLNQTRKVEKRFVYIFGASKRSVQRTEIIADTCAYLA